MRNLAGTIVLITTLAQANAVEPLPRAEQTPAQLPSPLIYLRDVDATIAQDIKYAMSDNFTGTRVEGYEAGECILTRRAAETLRQVQADLTSRKRPSGSTIVIAPSVRCACS